MSAGLNPIKARSTVELLPAVPRAWFGLFKGLNRLLERLWGNLEGLHTPEFAMDVFECHRDLLGPLIGVPNSNKGVDWHFFEGILEGLIVVAILTDLLEFEDRAGNFAIEAGDDES